MTPWPAWLRLGLLLPVLGLNAFVLKVCWCSSHPSGVVPHGGSDCLFVGPALPLACAPGFAQGLGHRKCRAGDLGALGLGGRGPGAAAD